MVEALVSAVNPKVNQLLHALASLVRIPLL